MKLKKPKSVEEYIEINEHYGKELSFLRALMMSTDLEESVKWMFPVYGYGKKNLMSLCAFKDYVGIWFFQGVFLEDKKGVLQNAQQGKTKAMRQWRFKNIDELKKHKSLIEAYILEAIQNHNDGKEVPVTKSKPTVILPDLLKHELSNNKNLKLAFNQLSDSKQKEYCDYISNAKREETKKKRLLKILPMIMEGVGLNDRYK